MRHPIRTAVVAVCLLALATAARAELAPWDQAKVTDLAKQLEAASAELLSSFRAQPAPTRGSAQRRSHALLRQDITKLRNGARALSTALQGGATKDQTLGRYRSLMQIVRRAQDHARSVFSGAPVAQRADAAREILNQLTPFYDANAAPLQPVRREAPAPAPAKP